MIWKKLFYLSISLLFSLTCAAEENSVLTPLNPEPVNGYWIFSGLVQNENHEVLGYFFQMERKNEHLHVRAAIIEERSGKVLLNYDQAEEQENPIDFNWKVGQAFLKFNPINESWIFGFKMPDKTGFNFRVDMLTNPVEKGKTQTVSPEVKALLHQTGRVDGLLQTDAESSEQFVTANNTWFSKIWMHQPSADIPVLHTGFCKFGDGSGFYSGRLEKAEIKQPAFAGFRDAEGQSVRMSQFIQINNTDNAIWKINLTYPKFMLAVNNKLDYMKPDENLAAGFFQEASKGFCFFSQHHFIG